MTHAERRELLDRLLKPAFDPTIEGPLKSAVLVRFFQIVLTARLLALLKSGGAEPKG